MGSPTLQTGAPLEGSYPNYLRSCNNDIEMEVAGAYGGKSFKIRYLVKLVGDDSY